METIKAKLKKILALAEKGVGGERLNAQRTLKRLLDYHGLTLSDLTDTPKPTLQRFVFQTYLERELLFGCFARMTANNGRVKYRQARKYVYFELTNLQAAELNNMYRYYRKLLKEVISFFFDKHGLYGPSNGEEIEDALTDEQRRAIILMLQGLGKVE